MARAAAGASSLATVQLQPIALAFVVEAFFLMLLFA
jgi:hypothetical protein